MDFRVIAKSVAKNMLPVVKYILGLPISPLEKRKRLATVFELVGSAFYQKTFSDTSKIFDSNIKSRHNITKSRGQIDRLALKIVRQNALGRNTDKLVLSFYDSTLGQAQAEAFANAVSEGKHPTLTRSIVGETCSWCNSLAGTHIYPSSDLFRRHRNCDCLFVVSGYNSRNGIVNNYPRSRKKNTTKKQDFFRSKENQRRLKKLESELAKSKDKTAQAVYQLAIGNKKQVFVGQLTTWRKNWYEKTLGLKLPGKRLIMSKNTYRHLFNSGHLTGIGKEGKNDYNPLSAQDIANLDRIFENPDSIFLTNSTNGATRIKIEKKLASQHRLIIELEEKHNRLGVVTFFNINKKSPP